ncbi:MAG: dTDP-4-dehydrorhamnose 3,5-epimerase [Chloroflexi bacterium]|nr:dTDP-4-dehydrorhamnose 3,5-epimerase [Chloroflexota bacterium]
MIFKEIELKGAYIIELEPLKDERGYFARTYCQNEFRQNGLELTIMQCDVSYNRKKGTLRGLHYQSAPHEEVKLVSCTRGSMYDVIVDIREQSPTYCRWLAVELTEQNRKMLYIPKGFAHGFQTLADDTAVYYQMSEYYHPGLARGIRWNDSALGINWPVKISIMAAKDRQFPDFIQ